MNLGQMIYKVMGNDLQKYFAWFEELCPKPMPFQNYQPTEIKLELTWNQFSFFKIEVKKGGNFCLKLH